VVRPAGEHARAGMRTAPMLAWEIAELAPHLNAVDRARHAEAWMRGNWLNAYHRDVAEKSTQLSPLQTVVMRHTAPV